MARDLSPNGSSGSDDALALFGAEAAEAKVAAGVPVPAHTPAVVSVEEVSKASALRFVEGVAVIQALTATIKAKGGVSAGMPDLQGAFLTPTGEVIAISPLGSKPAAPELARLLHQMVAADVTPPVGRLFIDRWVSSDSNDLTQFSTELEYFARPNGRELVTSVHARYAGSRRVNIDAGVRAGRRSAFHSRTGRLSPSNAEPGSRSRTRAGAERGACLDARAPATARRRRDHRRVHRRRHRAWSVVLAHKDCCSGDRTLAREPDSSRRAGIGAREENREENAVTGARARELRRRRARQS